MKLGQVQQRPRDDQGRDRGARAPQGFRVA